MLAQDPAFGASAHGNSIFRYQPKKINVVHTNWDECAVNHTSLKIKIPADLVYGTSRAIECWRYTLSRKKKAYVR